MTPFGSTYTSWAGPREIPARQGFTLEPNSAEIELLIDSCHDRNRAYVRATKIRKVWSKFGTQEGRRVSMDQKLCFQ